MSTANLRDISTHPLSNVWLQKPLPRTKLPTRQRTTSESRDSVSTRVWWTMMACSVVAIASSTYLAWASFTSSAVAGCNGGSVFDCDHVLHSRWSSVLSLPVSIPAIATHALVIGLLLTRPSRHLMQTLRWTLIGFASLTAGGAAIWFIGLQVFALQHLCPYCLVAHAGGLVLAGVYLWARPVSGRALASISIASALSLATLITIQLMSEEPETYEVTHYPATPAAIHAVPQSGNLESEDANLFEAPVLFEAPTQSPLDTSMNLEKTIRQSGREVSQVLTALVSPALLLHAQVGGSNAQPREDNATSQAENQKTARVLGGIQLNSRDWPTIGNPDAEYIFVELFDYTCPHCQRTHKSLEGARQRFGDRLAVMTLPVPLDSRCNPTVRTTQAAHAEACQLAKLAIAVWLLDREKFSEFHNYLFESTPNYNQAIAHARSLVDQSQLDQVVAGPTPGEFISKHVSLYQKAGGGTIPKLLFPSTSTAGAVESSEAMVRLIEQHLAR